MMNFDEWLKSELDNRSVSFKMFADQVGVSKSTVSMWARGKRRPDPAKAVQIAAGLNVPVEVVLGYLGYGMPVPERETDLRQQLSGLYLKRRDLREQWANLELQLADLEQEIMIEEQRLVALGVARIAMGDEAQDIDLLDEHLRHAVPPDLHDRLLRWVATSVAEQSAQWAASYPALDHWEHTRNALLKKDVPITSERGGVRPSDLRSLQGTEDDARRN